MGYQQNIRLLSDMVDAGLKSGPEALDAFLGLQADHQTKVQERRAARREGEDALNSLLLETASSAAQEGLPMAQLRPQLDSIVAQSGIPIEGKMPYGRMPGIDELYDRGQSLVTPQIPDVGQFTTKVSELAANGWTEAETLNEVLGLLQQKAPDQFDTLAPTVQQLVNQVYG